MGGIVRLSQRATQLQRVPYYYHLQSIVTRMYLCACSSHIEEMIRYGFLTFHRARGLT